LNYSTLIQIVRDVPDVPFGGICRRKRAIYGDEDHCLVEAAAVATVRELSLARRPKKPKILGFGFTRR
jgi:hypothetical protein